MSLRPGRLSGLGTRFDNQALQAFDVLPAEGLRHDWPALRAWCLAAPMHRLAVAMPGAGTTTDAGLRAQHLALQLDGSHALQACRSTAARLALRLSVKWQDLTGGDGDGAVAQLPAHRIWDSGRARGDAAALARFTPRRPSFIVLDQGPAPALRAALVALAESAPGWSQPVRVLWLLADAAPAGAVALAGR